MIVKYGLKKLGHTKNLGLKKLAEKTNLDLNSIRPTTLDLLSVPA